MKGNVLPTAVLASGYFDMRVSPNGKSQADSGLPVCAIRERVNRYV